MTEEELKATIEEFVKSRTEFIPANGKHYELNEICSLLEDAFEEGYSEGQKGAKQLEETILEENLEINRLRQELKQQVEENTSLKDKLALAGYRVAELKNQIEQLEKDYCNAGELCNQQALEITELKEQIETLKFILDLDNNQIAKENIELKNQVGYQKDCIKTQHETNNELNRQIEKMKCCENCKHYIDTSCELDLPIRCKYWYTQLDNTTDEWELA